METFGIQTKLIKDIAEYERYNIRELPVGTCFYGRLNLIIFENEERDYDNLLVNIIDDDNEEILKCYCNIPHKKEWINKSNNFYRTTFDLLFSYLRLIDETLIIGDDGEEVNSINTDIDWGGFIDYLNDKECTVKITDGNKDSDYNSCILTKLE